ncbi:MAG TPA: hypothetical protein QGG93_04555 [Verrucomicrobiota bacterium]|nr:hypothetical protein [Verrucomicrobiota bacterium]
MQKTNWTLGLLLLGGAVLCAQTALELGSKTNFYVVPGGTELMTRDEYVSRYRSNNSFQASNAVEVSVMHFNETAVVADRRKKASPKDQPKAKGPVVSISLVYTRPIFDSAFGTFSAADMAQVRSVLAKFQQWKTESAANPAGTELRRPFPQTLSWPVASEANGTVILTEQPLLFLRDQKGAAFLLLDKDKAFPGGIEKVTATAGAAAGGAAAAAAGADPAADAATAGGAGAGAKAKATYNDHWMSKGDVAVFEATLNKVEELLKQNQASIQKLR